MAYLSTGKNLCNKLTAKFIYTGIFDKTWHTVWQFKKTSSSHKQVGTIAWLSMYRYLPVFARKCTAVTLFDCCFCFLLLPSCLHSCFSSFSCALHRLIAAIFLCFSHRLIVVCFYTWLACKYNSVIEVRTDDCFLLGAVAFFTLPSCLCNFFPSLLSHELIVVIFPFCLHPLTRNQVRMHDCFPLVAVDCSPILPSLLSIVFPSLLAKCHSTNSRNWGKDAWLFLPCCSRFFHTSFMLVQFFPSLLSHRLIVVIFALVLAPSFQKLGEDAWLFSLVAVDFFILPSCLSIVFPSLLAKCHSTNSRNWGEDAWLFPPCCSWLFCLYFFHAYTFFPSLLPHRLIVVISPLHLHPFSWIRWGCMLVFPLL